MWIQTSPKSPCSPNNIAHLRGFFLSFSVFCVALKSSSLNKAHRYGPCSPNNITQPSLANIFVRDALRVASLQAAASGAIVNQLMQDEGVNPRTRSMRLYVRWMEQSARSVMVCEPRTLSQFPNLSAGRRTDRQRQLRTTRGNTRRR